MTVLNLKVTDTSDGITVDENVLFLSIIRLLALTIGQAQSMTGYKALQLKDGFSKQ